MRIRRISVLLLLVVIISGCKGNYPMTSESMSTPSPMYGYDGDTLLRNESQKLELEDAEWAYDAAPAPAAAPMSPQEAGGMTSAETYVTDTGAGSLGLSVPEMERKIIKNANVYIETYNFDESAATLLNTVLSKGGYIERSSTWLDYIDKDTGLKRGDYVIRVPQEHFETAKNEIEKIGKVISSSMGGDDVTGQYYDIESRLNIKKEEEKRVFELIAKAEKIEDLIKLEQRLSEIRADIEIYQTKLNSIDRLASFSTISVGLTEVREKDTIVYSDDFAGRVKESFFASINFVISFFQYAVLFITAIFVPALIVGIIGLIVWLFVKKKIAKK